MYYYLKILLTCFLQVLFFIVHFKLYFGVKLKRISFVILVSSLFIATFLMMEWKILAIVTFWSIGCAYASRVDIKRIFLFIVCYSSLATLYELVVFTVFDMTVLLGLMNNNYLFFLFLSITEYMFLHFIFISIVVMRKRRTEQNE